MQINVKTKCSEIEETGHCFYKQFYSYDFVSKNVVLIGRLMFAPDL